MKTYLVVAGTLCLIMALFHEGDNAICFAIGGYVVIACSILHKG